MNLSKSLTLASLSMTLLTFSVKGDDATSTKRDPINHKKQTQKLERFPVIQQIMGDMTQEDRDKLFGLHRENPKKFKEEMRKRIKSYRKGGKGKGQPIIQKLIKKYREASSDSERLKIESQIKDITSKQFEKRLQKSAKQLENLEKKVEQLRNQIENRKKNSQTIINNRVDELLKDPDLKW